jgi:4-aminobutyrate aminotransferase/(S)-3-amino-2-methylpropionate transaminase
LKGIEADGLCARAAEIGAHLTNRLSTWREAGLPIANIRGLGAMIGFDVTDVAGKPDGASAKAVTAAALANGLIVLSCGTGGETIRLLMPLTISTALMDEGMAVLADALSALDRGRKS